VSILTEIAEILPGVLHWSARHPKIRQIVHSYYVADAGAAIDPMVPAGLAEELRRRGPPQRVLLTNRHHLRSSERFAEELGCTINCHRAGLHEFEDGPEVIGFEWGEVVAPGIEALEVDAICDEETALLIAEAGALSIADSIVRDTGEVSFVPDGLLGDDPEGVKRGIREAYSRVLDRDFDHLLFAHGEPLVGGGKAALRAFCDPG
jgi:hypothetical protein